MPTQEFWIQLENHAWDINPNNINRMTGETVQDMGATPVTKTLTSPETGVTRQVEMFEPVEGEALILRRYTENWAQPDDRKVNPWDLNEQNPTDNGTMGTIPGATIDCNVGDDVIVYFRNKDERSITVIKQITITLPPPFGTITFPIQVQEPLPAEERAHSLHPHGIVFEPEHDGAYPLSPADATQPVGGEAALWNQLGVTQFKKGDRVPPGATFTYRWNTFGWPSTAGVWEYHDHSICDHHNVVLGAIGFLVIHNPANVDDVVDQDLPGDDPNGRLKRFCLQRLADRDFRVRPFSLDALDRKTLGEIALDLGREKPRQTWADEKAVDEVSKRFFKFENQVVEAVLDKGIITAFLRLCYVDPPQRATYLQLYHEMPSEHFGTVMAINGRRWLGNTPTLIGGLDTKMRFGLLAMNTRTFHTIHLHGHRWVIHVPSGGNVGGDVPVPGTGVQVSPMDKGISQFEDTRIFGPANTFSFTINQGSFMGPPLGGGAKGEWHMHCHVLGHMMGGMMGSLLIVEGGDIVTALPKGVKCPTDITDGEGEGESVTVTVAGFAFTPSNVSIASGGQVSFDFQEADHTVTTVSTTGAASSIEINNGGGPADAIPVGQTKTVTVTGNSNDEINYMCGIHGAGMSGKITIS